MQARNAGGREIFIANPLFGGIINLLKSFKKNLKLVIHVGDRVRNITQNFSSKNNFIKKQ
jgi:hypothetical protein